MKNHVHITCGTIPGRSLQRSFESRNVSVPDIISLEDDLRVGPLPGIDTETGDIKRRKWWEMVTETGVDREKLDLFYHDRKKLKRVKKLMEENQKICIWYGTCLFDQLIMARLLHFINPSPENISVVPVSEYTVTNKLGRKFVPDTLIVMASEQIEDLDPYLRSITPTEMNKAMSLWHDVESNNATMRVRGDTIIEIKEDSFYDQALLSNCTPEFQNSAGPVGKTLVDTWFNVSDIILNWRLKELVRKDKLEAEGQLKDLRDYQVKLSSFPAK